MKFIYSDLLDIVRVHAVREQTRILDAHLDGALPVHRLPLGVLGFGRVGKEADRALKGLIDPLLAAAGLDLGAHRVQLGTRVFLLAVALCVALPSGLGS